MDNFENLEDPRKMSSTGLPARQRSSTWAATRDYYEKMPSFSMGSHSSTNQLGGPSNTLSSNDYQFGLLRTHPNSVLNDATAPPAAVATNNTNGGRNRKSNSNQRSTTATTTLMNNQPGNDPFNPISILESSTLQSSLSQNHNNNYNDNNNNNNKDSKRGHHIRHVDNRSSSSQSSILRNNQNGVLNHGSTKSEIQGVSNRLLSSVGPSPKLIQSNFNNPTTGGTKIKIEYESASSSDIGRTSSNPISLDDSPVLINNPNGISYFSESLLSNFGYGPTYMNNHNGSTPPELLSSKESMVALLQRQSNGVFNVESTVGSCNNFGYGSTLLESEKGSSVYQTCMGASTSGPSIMQNLPPAMGLDQTGGACNIGDQQWYMDNFGRGSTLSNPAQRMDFYQQRNFEQGSTMSHLGSIKETLRPPMSFDQIGGKSSRGGQQHISDRGHGPSLSNECSTASGKFIMNNPSQPVRFDLFGASSSRGKIPLPSNSDSESIPFQSGNEFSSPQSLPENPNGVLNVNHRANISRKGKEVIKWEEMDYEPKQVDNQSDSICQPRSHSSCLGSIEHDKNPNCSNPNGGDRDTPFLTLDKVEILLGNLSSVQQSIKDSNRRVGKRAPPPVGTSRPPRVPSIKTEEQDYQMDIREGYQVKRKDYQTKNKGNDYRTERHDFQMEYKGQGYQTENINGEGFYQPNEVRPYNDLQKHSLPPRQRTEKDLRRMASNRESAKRSRLRKAQYETNLGNVCQKNEDEVVALRMKLVECEQQLYMIRMENSMLRQRIKDLESQHTAKEDAENKILEEQHARLHELEEIQNQKKQKEKVQREKEEREQREREEKDKKDQDEIFSMFHSLSQPTLDTNGLINFGRF